MTDDAQLIDRLRADLRAEVADVETDSERLLALAAPELGRRRALGLPSPPRLVALALPALAAGVVVVVLVVAGTIGGVRSQRPATTPPGRVPAPRPAPVTVPTLAQLIAHFAVLRRPQTA